MSAGCGRLRLQDFIAVLLTQPTSVLAFRTQRERQSGGGSRMSQTGTQRVFEAEEETESL